MKMKHIYEEDEEGDKKGVQLSTLLQKFNRTKERLRNHHSSFKKFKKDVKTQLKEISTQINDILACVKVTLPPSTYPKNSQSSSFVLAQDGNTF